MPEDTHTRMATTVGFQIVKTGDRSCSGCCPHALYHWLTVHNCHLLQRATQGNSPLAGGGMDTEEQFRLWRPPRGSDRTWATAEPTSLLSSFPCPVLLCHSSSPESVTSVSRLQQNPQALFPPWDELSWPPLEGVYVSINRYTVLCFGGARGEEVVR